jgi:GH24 family phage-related lysozyme (muramidase)
MIPQKAIDLILKSEGIDQPWSWPGGFSGITIGYGYDLGYEHTFVRDWRGVLPQEQIDALIEACGRRGRHAAEMASSFQWITIKKEQARLVFDNRTLPHYEAEAAAAFPGFDRLPDLARGALVSLVFNRGSGMVGARRAEMRAVRDAVKAGDLTMVALQIRAMKHLWVGQDLDGLLTRRDAEASLVQEAIA